jgi:iron complex transport system ATP-binding protein
VIAVRELTVGLDGRRIVDGLSIAVDRGSWLMLIGRNGAGKTTVLRALAGLVPFGGTITIAGDDTRAMGARARSRRLALVPQAPQLPDAMTVSEYVLLGRTPHLGYFGREGSGDWRIVENALASLDLEQLADRALGHLSGGERQRAVLARAVAQEPDVLLLDEPTSALDIGRQQEALDVVDELRAERGLTVLGAMHDLTLAGRYADRLALLDAGRLVAVGTPGGVLTEKLIGRHYRARVQVVELEGVPVIVPAREGAGAWVR